MFAKILRIIERKIPTELNIIFSWVVLKLFFLFLKT